MKLRILSIFSLAALLTAGAAAKPAFAGSVINFDDLPGNNDQLQNGYGGLDWDNVFAFAGCADAPGTGYCNGVTSPSNSVFNGSGLQASFSTAAGFFTLNSFELTAAFGDEQVTFIGYNLGVPVYQVTLKALESGPTLETLNWTNVDTVGFIGVGGPVVLDDITINGPVPSPVPEPSSIALLGTGLLGAMGIARRRFITGS